MSSTDRMGILLYRVRATSGQQERRAHRSPRFIKRSPDRACLGRRFQKLDELDANALDVSAGLVDFEPRQPYRLALLGEKTSLEDVLGPVAAGLRRRPLPHGGPDQRHTSCTAWRATPIEDGRPLVVFTFSDFDPAGYWDMPTAIGRKLQALRDLLFPSLSSLSCMRALGPEQVRDLDLPVIAAERGREPRREVVGALRFRTDGDRRARDLAAGRLRADRPRGDRALTTTAASRGACAWRGAAGEQATAVEIARDRSTPNARQASEAAPRSRLIRCSTVNAEVEVMRAEIEAEPPPPPDLPEPDFDALADAQDGRRSGADRQRHGFCWGRRSAAEP